MVEGEERGVFHGSRFLGNGGLQVAGALLVSVVVCV